jgi:cytochrome c peroxidase
MSLSRFTYPIVCGLHWMVLGLIGFAGESLAGSVLRVEVQPVWSDAPLKSGQVISPDKDGLRISRLDFLLSNLALRRLDGSWLESQDWFALISLEKGRLRAEADGIPAEKFTAIRFDVGVPPAINKADPAQWAPGHALHPDVCGLHWGWMGGYIFMALEGHTGSGEQTSGFSYHLANDANVARVELPVEIHGGGPLTLRLKLDAQTLLTGVLSKDNRATHSREGDPLAARLRGQVEAAFRVDAVNHDLYQEAEAAEKTAALPPGTHAYPLTITERFPKPALPADNPLTVEAVALGKKLFHDTRLSSNNSQSCASCHLQSAAFSDPRQVSLGAEGQAGKRNAMALVNLAWGQGFFWDGRAKTLREQVLMPVTDKHEMNETLERVVAKLSEDQGMGSDFQKAFGSSEITAERIAKALEQFLITLVSQESRFDKAVRKVAELSEEEKRGLQLFVTEYDPKRGLFGADCFHCHGGTLMTDQQFHNNGLALTPEDLGRMKVTGVEADQGKFKTPTLRNIALTAPYMHDGRFQTLEEVVEHYSSGVKRSATLDPNLAKHPVEGLRLSAEDKRALVAFLKTLTDEAFVRPSTSASEPNLSQLSTRQ